MVHFNGKDMSRESMDRHAGSISQFGGVRFMTLGDGIERGIRLLEFRTLAGLRFTVLIDRAMDIADCTFKETAIGWHSPAGFRHPSLAEYEGEGGLGWLRSFSGLLMTCGLDHILFMDEQDAAHFNYSSRKTVKNSIHGRVATIPATLRGYGDEWRGDHCVLWCEGVIRQAAVFGENLELIRRIEVDLDGSEIRITDRVVNRGFYTTPHMFCYHINLGHPLLDEGAEYVASIRDVVWAAHAGQAYKVQKVGYRTAAGPQQRFHEQVWEHDMAADAEGLVRTALINDRIDLAFCVTSKASQFPAQFEWQNYQAGQYALGIEPATHHVYGRGFAAERGELIWLEHGEHREYQTVFSVVSGRDAIEALRRRISEVCLQPDDEFPEPSGNFPLIEGRGK